jgi:hypothetical protein
MKRKIRLFVTVSICLLLLTSCEVTKHYVTQIIKKEDINTSKSKTVVVSGSDNVVINNFANTFEKNYKSKNDFVKMYIDEFSSQLKNNAIFFRVTNEAIRDFDSLKASTNADYVIDLPYFEVTNRVVTTHSAPMPNNNFGGMASSTEYCVVNVKVVVYDIKNKKRIIEFLSTGEDSVFLFSFTKSLQKAKLKSITHIINYLKEGKTEYRN